MSRGPKSVLLAVVGTPNPGSVVRFTTAVFAAASIACGGGGSLPEPEPCPSPTPAATASGTRAVPSGFLYFRTVERASGQLDELLELFDGECQHAAVGRQSRQLAVIGLLQPPRFVRRPLQVARDFNRLRDVVAQLRSWHSTDARSGS